MTASRARLATVYASAAVITGIGSPRPLAASPAVSAEAQSSAGYEWNINHAVDDASRADSAVARAGASVVLELLRRRHLDVYAEANVEGKTYDTYDDLSSVREAARLGALISVGSRGVAHVGARVGLRQYRDDERSGLELEASTAYRHRLARYVAARLGYAFQRHDAEAAVYDFDLHAASAGVVVGGWTAELGVRYVLERSDTTLYTTEQITDDRGRQERMPTNTFAPNEVAYREQTVGHAGELDVVARPRGWVRIGGSYRYGRLDTSSGWVSAQQAGVWLRLQWR